ncbi:ABC transporter permease [Epidermidibacterium keratini]|uniref:ABC transporter permease n=1 Tax=Epidermidibacterium keratini TaxID=1891644 RepID=A0A7L4YR22_9ACTN|nr:ABC transporter permease [Epidermidibacterium keratini]QHC01570.1 ABC transporter permease [Epidermidibacterium keratini]
MTNFLVQTVMAMVPFILVAQGTMLGGRAGLFNVSQEGMMMLGASIGFVVSWSVGGNNFLGLVAAAVAGGIFGFVFAFLSNLRLDQFVVGLAIFFLAMGLATLVYRVAVGVTLTPPRIDTLPRIEIPVLSAIPVIGPMLFNQNALVYFAILLSIALWWYLYRTNSGMRLRSVGENPKAADSLGIDVARTKLVAGTLGSALMALGGAYLPMVYTGTFTEGVAGGRGWLAIALAFFGGWRPQLIFIGAAFFAAMEVLALQAQVSQIGIPHQFIQMLPYVATLLVMVFAFRWVRVPAYLGRNYDRESRLTG